MKLKEYDDVKLKDGRIGQVIVYEEGFDSCIIELPIDNGKSYDQININLSEIETVLMY
ncbi:MAG: hypothetical protein MJ181_00900 [Treponema sp.]|nr:hypothetical protein [Treponema sp.]